jgi:hypothetical protein
MMRNPISVRLPDQLAEWLKRAAAAAGVSQGKIILDQLESAHSRRSAVSEFGWQSVGERQSLLGQGLFGKISALAGLLHPAQ